MSNISRRDFLKTAGVMTLAVAAAGVLAGCEGNAAKPEVPTEITKNSVTIGDYTVSLTAAKQFAVKTYTSVTEKPNEVESEARYVVVVGNILNNADTQVKPAFGANAVHTNMTESDKVTDAKVQELFDLTVAPIDLDTNNKIDNQTAAGTPVCWVYAVDTYPDKTFKAPKFELVLDDENGKIYHTLTVDIPAAVDAVKSDLGITT